VDCTHIWPRAVPPPATHQRPCDLVGSVDEELRDRLNVQFFEVTRPTGDGALPYSRWIMTAGRKKSPSLAHLPVQTFSVTPDKVWS